MIALPAPRAPEVMRRVNDLIWESLAAWGRDEPVAFFCECRDHHCYQCVWLTLPEYESARRDPEWTALAADHPSPSEVER